LIEKYAGAFPLWLAPEQVRIIPVADRHLDYCNEIKTMLEGAGIRVTIDDRAEKVGYKIRSATMDKLPVMLTIGDKEVEEKTVSVRSRREGDLGSMTPSQLLEKLVKDIAEKVR
ncbi:MAG: His/Gly/Thr/Pro-type tRNA ligase C-terminal domain-containing protein, partial [Porcipelethomonas sp.]